MNYLDLVRMVHRESGIVQTNPEPQTTNGLTGLSLKIANWVTQAYEDFKLENDQTEIAREWFYTTVNPRFYFDLQTSGLTQVFPGDVLIGEYSGCTFQVTNVIIVNNGVWADGSAQGFVEFLDLTGSPMDSEPLLVQSTNTLSCRFIKWGDYKLDSQVEMGNGWVANLEDVWWQSLRIADVASSPAAIQERALPFLDYSQFLQNYDVNQITLGTPRIVTETPDNGTRIAFYPVPDRPYRIGGYYYKTTAELTSDQDVPTGLKAIYHPMIAWRALKYYGDYEQQPGISQEASSRYAVFKKKFDRESELPVVMIPRRLY